MPVTTRWVELVQVLQLGEVSIACPFRHEISFLIQDYVTGYMATCIDSYTAVCYGGSVSAHDRHSAMHRFH